uniref:Uncharacterized protein n=1 Tax=Solanum lycopersicum TaxID=4081 RepID=A0A3Q7GGT0_SOLLC
MRKGQDHRPRKHVHRTLIQKMLTGHVRYFDECRLQMMPAIDVLHWLTNVYKPRMIGVAHVMSLDHCVDGKVDTSDNKGKVGRPCLMSTDFCTDQRPCVTTTVYCVQSKGDVERSSLTIAK